jgi:hypothetical protein
VRSALAVLNGTRTADAYARWQGSVGNRRPYALLFAVGETMYRAAFPNFRNSSSDIFLSRVRSSSTFKVVSWMECITVDSWQQAILTPAPATIVLRCNTTHVGISSPQIPRRYVFGSMVLAITMWCVTAVKIDNIRPSHYASQHSGVTSLCSAQSVGAKHRMIRNFVTGAASR